MASTSAHHSATRARLNRIVLGTDFSPVASRAASYAKGLAVSHSARVDLVHVFDTDVYLDDREPRLRTLEDRLAMRSARLQALAATFAQAGIAVKTELPMMQPGWRALLNSAETDRADLIVVATRSKPQLKRVFVGSTVEELIRHATLPVLTVGPHVPEAATSPLVFRRMLYATSFPAEAERAARAALMFAAHDQAKIFVAHVIGCKQNGGTEAAKEGDARQNLERVMQKSPLGEFGCELVVACGDPAPAILTLAEKVQADLIVMGPRKRTFLLTHVRRGVTLEVLAQARCPVLTVQG